MPFIVKFANFSSWPQSVIIPDATSKNDGVMTSTQAAKLGTVGLSAATVSDLPDPGVEGQEVVLQVSPRDGLPTIAIFTLGEWWIPGTPSAGTVIGPAPKITSFSPASGPPGTVITLIGSHFTDVTSISLGFVDCPIFTIVSDTEMTVTVPDTGVPGKIRPAVSASIVGTSSTSFSVTQTSFGAFANSLGCTARWRLNNATYSGSATNIGDSSGNENWAKVNGSPSTVAGLVAGDAFSPDGGNSFSNFITAQTHLPAAPRFSLAVFMKFSGVFNQSNDLGDGFADQSRGVLNADGSLTFDLHGSSVSTAAGQITVGPRLLVVYTYDGTTMKISINAVLKASTPAVVLGWTGTSPFQYAEGFEWDGAGAEVMFFPSALTLGQQAALLAAA